MTDHKWISLQTNTIAPTVRPAEAQWSLEAPSPYDVPTHFRVWVDSAQHLLIIEFRYIADEQRRTKNLRPYFQVEVGKRTGRIYAIRADLEELRRHHTTVPQETEQLFSGLPHTANREITQRAVELQKSRVLSYAAA